MNEIGKKSIFINFISTKYTSFWNTSLIARYWCFWYLYNYILMFLIIMPLYFQNANECAETCFLSLLLSVVMDITVFVSITFYTFIARNEFIMQINLKDIRTSIIWRNVQLCSNSRFWILYIMSHYAWQHPLRSFSLCRNLHARHHLCRR